MSEATTVTTRMVAGVIATALATGVLFIALKVLWGTNPPWAWCLLPAFLLALGLNVREDGTNSVALTLLGMALVWVVLVVLVMFAAVLARDLGINVDIPTWATCRSVAFFITLVSGLIYLITRALRR